LLRHKQLLRSRANPKLSDPPPLRGCLKWHNIATTLIARGRATLNERYRLLATVKKWPSPNTGEGSSTDFQFYEGYRLDPIACEHQPVQSRSVISSRLREVSGVERIRDLAEAAIAITDERGTSLDNGGVAVGSA
jgi:hypothetical protein